MFKLHLDLHLHYVPPMCETGPGVVVTRELQLPFPPHEDLRVFSRSFDECPDPVGFALNEVVWDVDRQVFLAGAYVSNHDLPMAFIADDIRACLDRGWRFGSFCEDYPQPDDMADEPAVGGQAPIAADTDDDMERLHMLAPQRRPKEFNRLMKALVRHMAETFNNSAVAYAMDKTGRYFSEEDAKGRDTDPAVRRWRDLHYEFSRLASKEQLAWRDRVARYRSIAEVLTAR